MPVDEMAYRQDVVPAICANEHLSYPGSIRLRGGTISLSSDAKVAHPCPKCAAERVIPAGTYAAGDDGVRRIGAPGGGGGAVMATEDAVTAIRGIAVAPSGIRIGDAG